jgi:hypothetical protein
MGYGIGPVNGAWEFGLFAAEAEPDQIQGRAHAK